MGSQKNLRATATALLFASALFCLIGPTAKGECSGEQEAKLGEDLERRLKPYLKLREKVRSQLPALTGTNDAAKLRQRQESLANAIRAARPDARQGDVLDSSIANCLTPLIQRNLKATVTKRALKEGNPAHEGPRTEVAVNAPYASDAPLSTMPPRLLAELPKLPDGLEYRFVGEALILYDADACLIIDFLYVTGA